MSAMSELRVVVLVSGRGSNLRALQAAIDEGACPARVVGVVADREKRCDALRYARSRDIATQVISPREHAERAAWDAALADAIGKHQPELVVLAGFMRIVGATVLARFGGRIVNVHPSLLPAFAGMDAPQQAIDAGVRITGCTVHLVDAGVDTGPILAQAALAVRASEDATELHARIQRLEHRLLPHVVGAVARGALQLADGPRWRDGEPSALFDGPLSRSAS